MKILKYVGRLIIKNSFNLSVWTITQLNDMTPCELKFSELQKFPVGTLGKDIADCLENNKLRLVPNFESHDLKHVLLDFKMTPVDEIRMQAFMLGNGNYTLPCIAILSFGIILLPDKWRTLYKDFRQGQAALPISNWTIDHYAERRTEELRRIIFENSYNKQMIMTTDTVAKYGALTAIFAGIFGMIFCLPFLFSSLMVDLVGAGFPFLAGAILVAGGLLSLTNLSKKEAAATYS